MGGSHLSPYSLPMSSLLCEESETCLDGEESFIKMSNFGGVCDDDEYVEMLFARENQLGFVFDSDWIKCARLDSITWILKTRAVFGFQFQTAYLSMTYFDRFISKLSIDIEKSWAIRLLSVACLSLAAKMEELNVPALSEFEIEDYNFESIVIQRMELLVLNTLEWRMDSITPFAFIHYFIRKLHKEDGPPPPSVSLSRIVDLIVSTMREISSMQHRPSVIAFAAILVVLDHRLTRSALESKISCISCCGYLEIEDVFTCYRLMQAWEAGEDRASKLMHTPGLSPAHLKPVDGQENPSVNSSSSKRKRLSFNNCDQNYDMPNEKRVC